eukprot:Amastigsp_a510256_65.p5 type:complete len:103 gc:universal Amastigsp_a510256_65:526-218(-)
MCGLFAVCTAACTAACIHATARGQSGSIPELAVDGFDWDSRQLQTCSWCPQQARHNTYQESAYPKKNPPAFTMFMPFQRRVFEIRFLASMLPRRILLLLDVR